MGDVWKRTKREQEAYERYLQKAYDPNYTITPNERKLYKTKKYLHRREHAKATKARKRQ